MEKILILDMPYHKVFYVKNNDVRFYISIPKSVNSTNISIELKNKMGNYDIENNDYHEVIDNLKNTFNYVDHYNITLVLPILGKELIDILEKIDTVKFDLVDNAISEIINDSYKVLIDETKTVSSQIVLVNNDRYRTFIMWFKTKYKERISCKSLLELVKIYNVNATTYKKFETSMMNFVVGSYNTEIDAPKIVKKEENKMELVKPRELQPSSGFASYLILIIVAVIVLALVAIAAFLY